MAKMIKMKASKMKNLSTKKLAILIFVLGIGFSIATGANAATIYVASCSQEDVQAAIDFASDGDTVFIPAGNCTWTAKVEVPDTKGLRIIGAGIDQTIITPDPPSGKEALKIITADGNSPTEVAHFAFQNGNIGGNSCLNVLGTARNIRVHHMKFDNLTVGKKAIWWGWAMGNSGLGPYGVIDHCTFTQPASYMSIWFEDGQSSYTTPTTWGTADALYIEDNTFAYGDAWSGAAAIDGCCGGRVVFRYNTVTNNFVATHGYDSADRTAIQNEIYENTFEKTADGYLHEFIYSRGGSWVVYNNTMSGTLESVPIELTYYRACGPYANKTECNGSQSEDGNEATANGSGIHTGGNNQITLTDNSKSWDINEWSNPYNYYIYDLTDGSMGEITANTDTTVTATLSGGSENDWNNGDEYKITNGYPCFDQNGRGPNQSLEPCYEWNNTLNGVDTHFVVGWHCTRELDLTLEGRDFYNNTPKPGYTPYIYPHPLTVGALANTYYIDFENGNDDNDGLSRDTPWKHAPGDSNASGNAGSVILHAGDLVYFKRGVTYKGIVDLTSKDWNGTERVRGTNATIASDGVTLTVIGADFLTNGVLTSDNVYIAGEGLFNISSIDSETQLTLTSSTLFRPLSDVPFAVFNPITFTATDWGTGPVIFDGENIRWTAFRIGRVDYVMVDGFVEDGFEIINHTTEGIYAKNYSADPHYGIILRNLKIHDNGTDFAGLDQPAIHFTHVRYGLIDGVEIYNHGNRELSGGDDGITSYGMHQSTITNCEIYEVGDDGIQGLGNSAYIQFCNFHDIDVPGVHADVIAGGLPETSPKIGPQHVRYNVMWNNLHSFDFNNIIFKVYYNIFYNGRNFSPRINIGSEGDFYNNIVAFNRGGLYLYPDVGDVNIRNNIFYENATSDWNQREVEITNTDSADVRLKNNLYVRKAYRPRDDIIAWGGIYYTLSEFQSLHTGPDGDNGYGSKACTPSDCDWDWQNPFVFVNEEYGPWSSSNLRPADSNSPQVDIGFNWDQMIDIDGNPMQGIGWDIGSYEFQETGPSIPTLSEWGLIILALLMLALGTIAVIRRRLPAFDSG